ncbi:hypothetical protein [Paenibacillus eucommiae]|uniref:Gfo/Idh/MocA-like oxidoreductase N-terminal domain-containing protein n=1 Tax=Paenibacillus eucommiae TaxID=1355755 RepID=A0ABS4J524_9BACL|nr:hypothetical protein [Paenibacillus eucommiae]MBP1994920.1 hypothetical protein [Paenibacillus eucommiae]
MGATVYDHYEDLLQQDLDAVWVATPDHLHVDIANVGIPGVSPPCKTRRRAGSGT